MIPIINKLRKESHRQVAIAQDVLMEELYAVFGAAVFHGGTAIWRCYQGGRFSEDIDVYIERDVKKLNQLFSNIEAKGLEVIKKKIGENSLFSKVRFNRHIVSLEALFKKKKAILTEYEKVDGSVLMVYSLTADQFIEEKVLAYLGRRKIRDLYDIFFLLQKVEDKKRAAKILKKFVEKYTNPTDEKDIKTIVLTGAVPNSRNMIDYIGKWAKRNI